MILNIYGDKGWEFVAQHGPVLFQPGGYEPAFIETTPFLTYGHGKEQMTDALAVFDLFVRLVPGLNALAPDAVLARFNRLLEASSDKAASSFDAIVGTLSDLLITDGSLDSVDADNTRALSYAHLIAVKNKIESLPVVDRQLIDIQDYSSADALAEAATSDVALRYALLNLDPFAISGDDALYVQHNSAGELNLTIRQSVKGSPVSISGPSQVRQDVVRLGRCRWVAVFVDGRRFVALRRRCWRHRSLQRALLN
ncbi:MAG: hypothetical protein H6962_15295 [Chromatiaceae bacterium]|nr:hypothetical protein [Chromatiaceae bacterium]